MDGNTARDRPYRGGLSDDSAPDARCAGAFDAALASGGWSTCGHFAHYTSFVLPFIIAGVGISMALPCVTAGGLNAVPPELLGKAAGTLNTTQQFGAVFGVAVVTAMFNAHGSLASSATVTSGYRPALAVSAGASVLGALVAVGIRRARQLTGPAG